MVGEYQVRTKIIENWLEAIINDSSTPEYNDLHINEINQEFETKQNWLEAGLSCLQIAADYLNLKKSSRRIFLAIQLRSEEIFLGVNFKNIVELKKEFDEFTPPSLYVFSEEQWADISCDCITIDFLDLKVKDIKCCLIEYKETTEQEYRRSLWFGFPQKSSGSQISEGLAL